MNILLAELLICLLIAGVIGFIAGWIFSKVGYTNKILKVSKIKDNEISILKSSFEKKCDLLNKELNKVESEKESLKEKLEYEIEQNSVNCQKKLDSIIEKRDELEVQVSNLNNKIEGLKQENRNLRVKLDNCESEYIYKIELLEQEKNSLIKELENLKETQKNVSKNLVQEKEFFASKLAENESKVSELKDRIKSLLIELEQKDELLESKIGELVEIRRDKERDIEKLKKELSEANEHIEHLEENIKKFLQEIDELKQFQKDKSAELDNLKIELNKKRESEAVLENKLKEIKSVFELKEKELLAKNSDIQKKIDEVILEKEENQRLISDLNREKELLEKKLKECEINLSKVEQDDNEFRSKFDSLKSGYEKRIKELEEEKKVLIDKLNALKKLSVKEDKESVYNIYSLVNNSLNIDENSTDSLKENNIKNRDKLSKLETVEIDNRDKKESNILSLKGQIEKEAEVDEREDNITSERLSEDIDVSDSADEEIDYLKYENDDIEINPLKDKLLGLKSSLNEGLEDNSAEIGSIVKNGEHKEGDESDIEIKIFDRVNKHKAKGMKRVRKVRRGLMRKNIIKKDKKKDLSKKR